MISLPRKKRECDGEGSGGFGRSLAEVGQTQAEGTLMIGSVGLESHLTQTGVLSLRGVRG